MAVLIIIAIILMGNIYCAFTMCQALCAKYLMGKISFNPHSTLGGGCYYYPWLQIKKRSLLLGQLSLSWLLFFLLPQSLTCSKYSNPVCWSQVWLKIGGDSDRKRVPETWPCAHSRMLRSSLVLAEMMPSLELGAGRQRRPGTWVAHFGFSHQP